MKNKRRHENEKMIAKIIFSMILIIVLWSANRKTDWQTIVTDDNFGRLELSSKEIYLEKGINLFDLVYQIKHDDENHLFMKSERDITDFIKDKNKLDMNSTGELYAGQWVTYPVYD